jgi:phosphoribosyl-AMP cyclohydrolase
MSSPRKLTSQDLIEWDADGLVVGVIQDSKTQQVLMVGYFSKDSLKITQDTGFVTFWSRSRKEIWVKGETSGNNFKVVDIHFDCDGDALLILVTPIGPACHTGAVTCFDGQIN